MKRNLVKKETRECIATALVKLTAEKPLSSISVTELCDVAGVSRMAFYRNYDSKEDVFSSKLDDLIEDYKEVTSLARAQGSPWYGITHHTTCFSFFKQNSEFVDSLFRCGYTQLLVDSIACYVSDTWGNGSEEGDYVLTAFAGSLCSCYWLWNSKGFKESPMKLAEIVGKFYTSIPVPNKNV